MPVITTQTVYCDRCKRQIPSGYLWPYTFGATGVMQSTGNICADLPDSCKDLIQAVFWNHTVVPAATVTDSL